MQRPHGGLCNHPRFTLPTHMLLLAAAGAGPGAAWQLGGRDSWVVQAQRVEQPGREKRGEGGEEQLQGRDKEVSVNKGGRWTGQRAPAWLSTAAAGSTVVHSALSAQEQVRDRRTGRR